MGTWDYGLLDNDSAADELGEILDPALVAARRAATQDLTPQEAGRLAAQIALLVHYDFATEVGEATDVRTGITRNRAMLAKVAPKAALLLARITSDDVPEDAPLRYLFEAKHANEYLQSLADTALEEVEDCLEEQRAGAHLDVLTVIAPYVELHTKTVKHIARRVRELAGETDDDEERFFDAYQKACKVLLKRAASAADGDDDD